MSNPSSNTSTQTTQACDSVAAVMSAKDTITKFVETAGVTDVYGEPITYGDTMIIPAAEVLRILGVGYGGGTSKEEKDGEEGAGSGGGGGGRTLSRPVAVVIASPQGVRVEPVLDPTKIALAAITVWGFIVAMVLRMIKARDALREIKQQ